MDNEAALPEELAGPYRATLTRLQDAAPPMPAQAGLGGRGMPGGPKPPFRAYQEPANKKAMGGDKADDKAPAFGAPADRMRQLEDKKMNAAQGAPGPCGEGGVRCEPHRLLRNAILSRCQQSSPAPRPAWFG